MIVQQRDVKGGIAAVTNGYYGSRLEDDYDVRYVESYRDGSKWDKLLKALKGYLEFERFLMNLNLLWCISILLLGRVFIECSPFCIWQKDAGYLW